MNLKQLHDWTAELLAAGGDPNLPVTCLVDGWPCEIAGATLATGGYNGDPAPKLVAYNASTGHMLVLEPIGQDTSGLFNPQPDGGPSTHAQRDLPVEFPYPA